MGNLENEGAALDAPILSSFIGAAEPKLESFS
jgi:hypothetical protein